MNWETILFLGDSITNGARSYLSFPEYTGNLLEKQTGKHWNIINFSQNGITANDLNKLVAQNFAALKAHDSSLVVLMIGTNDAKGSVNTDDFIIAYDQLVIKAKLLAQHKTVLLISIPPLQNGIMFPYDIDMNKDILAYNNAIKDVVIKHGSLFVEIDCDASDFYDGVHLNKKGAENFALQISKLILQKRGI